MALPQGLTGHDVDILSPEFPCGAAWLANCLLELGVPLWHLWGFDVRGEWVHCGAQRYRYAAQSLPWRQTLFLSLDATDRQIALAVQRSDFGLLKRVEDDLADRGELRRQFNRRGKAFEYREAFTPGMHRAVGRVFDDICDWLGYEAAPQAETMAEPGPLGGADVGALLAALKQASSHGDAVPLDLLRRAVR